MNSLTELAGDLNVSTEQVLTALQIVATRADIEEFADWAAKELEGYTADDVLPTHRVWKLTIVASLLNPMQVFMRDVHVGDMAIEKEYRKKVTTFYCKDGVGEIERTLASTKDDDELGAEHPNLAMLINKGPFLQPGWACTHAKATFSISHMQAVVTKARQTALQICLQCEKKGIHLQWGGRDSSSSPKEYNSWLKQLQDQATKEIIRGAWTTVREAIYAVAT